ncbi:MAG: hypothetical protein R3A46_11505 [Thermomicrobiales bacterium]
MSADYPYDSEIQPEAPPRRRPPRRSDRRDWRNWLLSGTVRAGVATGFLMIPTVRVQLGEAAIALLCLFLGVVLAGVLGGHWYIARRTARRDIAADIVAIVALTPSAIVAAGIQGAEDRFGGRTVNVLAALGSTLLIFAIVAFVAQLDERIEFGAAAMGSLGGALTFAALLANPDRYSANEVWQPLSIAWMVAAGATILFGVLPGGIRSFFPIAVYVAFAAVFLFLPVETTPEESASGVESLAILATVITGAIMILIAPARTNVSSA